MGHPGNSLSRSQWDKETQCRSSINFNLTSHQVHTDGLNQSFDSWHLHAKRWSWLLLISVLAVVLECFWIIVVCWWHSGWHAPSAEILKVLLLVQQKKQKTKNKVCGRRVWRAKWSPGQGRGHSSSAGIDGPCDTTKCYFFFLLTVKLYGFFLCETFEKLHHTETLNTPSPVHGH